jgi:pimeloyl-ACP methyl ester carboxylesterase
MIQGTIDTRPLAPALSGERREIDSGAAGRLSFYCDRPAAREGTAVPLLLIHSVNAAASAYEVRPLYQHYRAVRPVYALDLPGYGFSSREDRPYTPGLMTGAVLAMVSEIRREHEGAALDALAISLSCEFLARAATETPGAFRSLALVNPTGFNRRALREGVRESTLGRARVRTLLRSPRWRRGIFDLLTRRRK